jgi:hypothetical protein
MIPKKQRPKISCYCPFKILWIAKKHGGKKIYNFKLLRGKNMPEIAEVKLSSCGLEVADLKKNCDCGIAVAEQHSFKSCGIAFAEVLSSSCGIAIADSKKSCACPPLKSTNNSVLITECRDFHIWGKEVSYCWQQWGLRHPLCRTEFSIFPAVIFNSVSTLVTTVFNISDLWGPVCTVCEWKSLTGYCRRFSN